MLSTRCASVVIPTDVYDKSPINATTGHSEQEYRVVQETYCTSVVVPTEVHRLSGFIPIFDQPDPHCPARLASHINQPDPLDLTGPCLILFMDSCMFPFYNRISLHLLSLSTFYLRLDPQSSILILVTYLL